MKEVEPGELVMSCAGRDKGRFMIVLKVIDDQYVYVADGKLRKVERPKKKKLKHLKVQNKISDFIREKLMNGRKVYNEEIRRALEELIEKPDDNRS